MKKKARWWVYQNASKHCLRILALAVEYLENKIRIKAVQGLRGNLYSHDEHDQKHGMSSDSAGLVVVNLNG